MPERRTVHGFIAGSDWAKEADRMVRFLRGTPEERAQILRAASEEDREVMEWVMRATQCECRFCRGER